VQDGKKEREEDGRNTEAREVERCGEWKCKDRTKEATEVRGKGEEMKRGEKRTGGEKSRGGGEVIDGGSGGQRAGGNKKRGGDKWKTRRGAEGRR